MPGRSTIWRVVVPVLLIAAMVTMSVGLVCHSHTDCSACTCQLCHLVVAPSLVDPPSNALVTVGERPEAQPLAEAVCSDSRQIPARAPPA